MLRITSHVTTDECLLQLEGCLSGAWVAEVARCWRDAADRSSRRVRVDLTEVSHADEAGRTLLAAMHREGVRFVAAGFVMPEIVREISIDVGEGQRS